MNTVTEKICVENVEGYVQALVATLDTILERVEFVW